MEKPGTVDGIFEAICQYYELKVYITMKQFIFFRRSQSEGEKFDKFLRDNRNQAKRCDFRNLEENLINDWIVLGIKHLGLW